MYGRIILAVLVAAPVYAGESAYTVCSEGITRAAAFNLVHDDDRLPLFGTVHYGVLTAGPMAITLGTAQSSQTYNTAKVAISTSVGSYVAFCTDGTLRTGYLGNSLPKETIKKNSEPPTHLTLNTQAEDIFCACYSNAIEVYAGKPRVSYTVRVPPGYSPVRALSLSNTALASALNHKIAVVSFWPPEATIDNLSINERVHILPGDLNALTRHSTKFLGAMDHALVRFDATDKVETLPVRLNSGETIQDLFRTKKMDVFIAQVKRQNQTKQLYKLTLSPVETSQ